MSYQKIVYEIVGKLSGNGNILSVNRVFCQVMGGLERGVFVSQLVYWSDKGRDKDGWFYKTYAEWEEEIMIPERTLRRMIQECRDFGWLETDVRKVGNNPTMHFRVHQERFVDWLVSELQKHGKGSFGRNLVGSNLAATGKESFWPEPYTYTTTETTTENTIIAEAQNNRASAHPKHSPQPGTMDFSRMHKEEPGRAEQSIPPTLPVLPVRDPKVVEYLEGDPTTVLTNNGPVPPRTYEKVKRKPTTAEEIVREDRTHDEKVLGLWARMGKQANTRYEKAMQWARGYKLLAKASESLIELSYLVYEHTGFVPVGVTFQNWSKQVTDLWTACNNHQGIFIRALMDGEKARKEGGLSFTGPRSYVSFARNLASLEEKRKLEESRPVNGNVHTEGRSKHDRGTGLTGQYDKNGEEIIRIGSGRKR